MNQSKRYARNVGRRKRRDYRYLKQKTRTRIEQRKQFGPWSDREMTEAQLREVALGRVDGTVYFDSDYGTDVSGMMWLVLCELRQIPRNAGRAVSDLRTDHTSRTAINGLPFFMSGRFVLEHQMRRLDELIEEAFRARRDWLGDQG